MKEKTLFYLLPLFCLIFNLGVFLKNDSAYQSLNYYEYELKELKENPILVDYKVLCEENCAKVESIDSLITCLDSCSDNSNTLDYLNPNIKEKEKIEEKISTLIEFEV